ncbi:MAG: hypothetical protein JG777_593 [Clostridia bacterium]|jgi:hypothetical protein|nr:hypothetical protein [Clostridia bacterium]
MIRELIEISLIFFYFFGIIVLTTKGKTYIIKSKVPHGGMLGAKIWHSAKTARKIY